jgi:hypothetical protein
MASFKNINTDYTLNVGTPAGNGVFTVNAQVVFTGNVTYNVPSVTSSPFLTVAANNTGGLTDMGIVAQLNSNSYAGLRFDTTANTWQISSSVYANGAPQSAYLNLVAGAAGNNTQIQFNNNGNLGGSNNFTYNNSSNLVALTGNISASGNITARNFIGNVAGNITGSIPASANIIYVAKNGYDGNNGTLNAPFLTIKAALAAAYSATGNVGGISIHVAPGLYQESCPLTITPNISLMGDNIRSIQIQPTDPAQDIFYMTSGTYVWGITVKNYKSNAFSYNPNGLTCATYGSVYVSPYIQNITSYTSYPSGPGGTCFSIDGSLVDSSSTKAMILGFATIINQNGVGVSVINEGYSQAVNIYTIYCNIGVQVTSGGFITLNACDTSAGNYGLIASGVGNVQTTGSTLGNSTNGSFIVNNLSNGQPHVNTVMTIPGDSNYYTIDTIIPIDAQTYNVIIQQVYTNTLPTATTVTFRNRSAIIASAHTFEYVGAGTTYSALPQYGGIPIEANEVIQTGGGVITFTSTDQKGNFKVGTGFTINQATGTITGTDFYQSLFAQMTPFILALGSN